MPRAKQRPVVVEVMGAGAEVVDLPVPLIEPQQEPRGSLFEDLDDDDVVVTAAVGDVMALPPIDEGLSPDEKAEFIALLNKEMPLPDRARQLGILARKTGQKTAAVGLRAIIEINEVTGIRKERATEAASMFQLPPGASVSITVQKVEK